MARTRTPKSVTVHGWRAEGATLAEARRNALAAIEEASRDYWSPTVCGWKGYVGMVYREPGQDGRPCYCYSIVLADGGEVRTTCISMYDTKEEALRCMLNHLASITHTPGEPIVPPPFLTDELDRREYCSSAAWQNGYHAHKVAHPDSTDEERREAACRAQTVYAASRWVSMHRAG